MTSHTDTSRLAALQQVITERRHADPQTSYVAALFAKGKNKMARKVAEEALEVALAATTETRKEVISESADLLFHLLVLWEAEGVSLDDVLDELAWREGVSGIDEKANRKL
jgi:phosphoribosyl-ATP pyrophosphohydrolase